MSRGSSGVVAGLTAAALATVGFLAWQAAAAPYEPPRGKDASASASPSPKTTGKDKGTAKSKNAVPADSGKGKRVVYSLGDDRVWLVEESGEAAETFEVTPGSVDPSPGDEYAVESRSASTLGTDGVEVEHIVRFATVDGVTVGFSAAVDGSTPAPDESKRTGGIRESREDGTEMWEFALIGTPVVVVR